MEKMKKENRLDYMNEFSMVHLQYQINASTNDARRWQQTLSLSGMRML